MSSANSGAIANGYLNDFTKPPGNNDHLTRMGFNEFRLRLPELLLMRVDKIGMSASIEARLPFMDHNWVEYTQNIPQNLKVKVGVKKYLLKKEDVDLLSD